MIHLHRVVRYVVLTLALGLMAISISSGCASRPKSSAPEGGAEPSLAGAPILSPGDEVEVKFYYTPELNVTQAVRPDGKIMLQLIGEVQAQGKTPEGLRAELLTLYGPHLRDPDIAVLTRRLYNRRVYVGGQVMLPGVVDMPAQMTVLEAIMQAGGFNMREAEVRSVIVIRHEGGQRYAYSVNLKAALEGHEAKAFCLQPRDIVYVPRTDIAKVNQWVDQHINRIIPQTGFFFSRRYGDTTVGIDTSAR